MSHPYSIYIWQPSRNHNGRWIEPLQVDSEHYAIYTANLIHKDSNAVVKVVRYGLNIACFPDEETVKKIDRFIEQQKQKQAQ